MTKKKKKNWYTEIQQYLFSITSTSLYEGRHKSKQRVKCIAVVQTTLCIAVETNFTAETVKVCVSVKICGVVNGRSGGLKHYVTRFAASVQLTWCSSIQILHICNDVLSLIHSVR